MQTIAAVLSAGAQPAAGAIVVLSDGKENKPGNPNNLRGAYTAAQAAKTRCAGFDHAFGTDAARSRSTINRCRCRWMPACSNRSLSCRWAVLCCNQHRRAEPQLRQVQQQVGYQNVPGSAGGLVASGRHRLPSPRSRIGDQPSAAELNRKAAVPLTLPVYSHREAVTEA